ncbi:unnamed protein product [Timema podura]|uniref:Uncharacterized protein n=2 Tax=Timema TaxID=61471 RepID=A0ABN7PK46_TIMPD|nr:unnamed protein product [Timema podura]
MIVTLTWLECNNVSKLVTGLFGLYYAPVVSGYATPLTESAWKVTMEDISALKQGLVTVFNDNFSKKLLDIAQNDTSVKRGFIEALLRRIKRLIQFVPVK